MLCLFIYLNYSKSIAVDVKWGKETYKDVAVDLSKPPEDFKQTLFTLTNVAPERQKGLIFLVYSVLILLLLVMMPGGVLKEEWGPFKNKMKNVRCPDNHYTSP